jgi:hypothetical protein
MSDAVHEPEDVTPPPPVLTERQRKFVDAYMGEANGNGTKAARLAGYAGDDNTLAVAAYDLLRTPKIRSALDARLEGDPLIAGRLERTRFLTSVVRVEPCAPALKDRLAALEMLSKLAGEQVNKVALSKGDGSDLDLSKAPTAELFALMGMAGGGK